jgi:hypothetical protein
MSLRRSAGRPFACSGLMYAAVPRIMPACVMAGVVMVGDIETFDDDDAADSSLGQAEVEHLHGAVVAHLDVRGLQVAMDDPLFVRRFERFGNLPRDRQRLGQRDGAAREPLRQVLALDQFHDERDRAVALFEAVNRADVGMIQRGEHLRLAPEAR